MAKAKHWLCIAAVTLALAPLSWADDSTSVESFFQDLLARIVGQVVGPADADPSELGIHMPVGGANATGNPSEIGIHIPAGGAAATGDPGPGNQPEIGGQIPAGG